MKKIAIIMAAGLFICSPNADAQSSKKPAARHEAPPPPPAPPGVSEAEHDRHKKFWKRVGNDQKNFWKGEHERHMQERKAGEAPAPPPPPKPFKKKKA